MRDENQPRSMPSMAQSAGTVRWIVHENRTPPRTWSSSGRLRKDLLQGMTNRKILVPRAHPQGHDVESDSRIGVRRRQNSVFLYQIGVICQVIARYASQ
jgi:hypothetical protein